MKSRWDLTLLFIAATASVAGPALAQHRYELPFEAVAAAGDIIGISATCPAGPVLSGGFVLDSAAAGDSYALRGSYPMNERTWRINLQNHAGYATTFRGFIFLVCG